MNHHFTLDLLLVLGTEESFFFESFLLFEGLDSFMLIEDLKSLLRSKFLVSSTSLFEICCVILPGLSVFVSFLVDFFF